jgi:hypothetical protein
MNKAHTGPYPVKIGTRLRTTNVGGAPDRHKLGSASSSQPETPAEILAFLATTELGLRGRLREDDSGGREPGGSDEEHEDGPEEEARRTVGMGTWG